MIFQEVEEQLMSMPEEERFDWQEIFKLFHKPDVVGADFKFKRIDGKKIKKILVEEHDFSLERVEKQLDKLKEIHEERKQKDLGKWF